MRVELKGIRKVFGQVVANDDVSLTVEAGTIHGLLGENGAGKSTLMKVLSGFIHADAGELRLDGKQIAVRSPAEGLGLGVGMLHQDPLDFPPLRVLDNFILGRDHRLPLEHRSARRRFSELCTREGFDLDPDASVADLTVGERQQLEIVRLLWLGARVLILDEPTTGISAIQKERLFATLRHLATQGLAVILVTHKLADVEELCDRVTVMREGRVVGALERPFKVEDMVRLMFDQPVVAKRRPPIELGGLALRLSGARMMHERIEITDLDLEISAGEVMGLAGLEGSGQQLLLRAVAGLQPLRSGRIEIDGRDLTGAGYLRFLQIGVAFMPADRMGEGLIPGLTISEHGVLARRGKQPGRIDWKAAETEAAARIRHYSIKGDPGSRVESLSGGNQQRTQLALLPANLRLLALEHPTRGLDVESALAIWEGLLERRRQGTAIIFYTADLDELLLYADRILVFSGGSVSPPLPAESLTVDSLGAAIGGRL
jgi:simple sugar transport system ATP-binding protein